MSFFYHNVFIVSDRINGFSFKYDLGDITKLIQLFWNIPTITLRAFLLKTWNRSIYPSASGAWLALVHTFPKFPNNYYYCLFSLLIQFSLA